MLYVSTRRTLDNENRLGPTSFWNLNVSNQIELDRRQIDFDELLDKINGKSILLLVHGYNNEFEDIVRAYDMIQSRVRRFLNDWYDEVIGFTWPGGDDALDWYGPKRRAGIIGPRLAQFVANIRSHVEVVDLMSHSLGARVVLSGLNLLPVSSVRANFLTASAVDNESIENGQKYFAGVKASAVESVVFHSKRDFVLKSAYRLAEWDNPLGLFGPENPADVIHSLPNVYVANCKNVIFGHGEYKTSDPVFRFIDRWMQGNVGSQFVTL